MANEVEIVVTSKNRANLKGIGAQIKNALSGSVRDGMRDADREMSNGFDTAGQHAAQTVRTRFREVGRESGRAMADGFRPTLRDGVSRSVRDVDQVVRVRYREVGHRSGLAMASGLVAPLRREVAKGASEAGSAAGSAMSQGAKAASSNWVVAVAAIAVALAALPVAGAVAATGLVLAFGAGLAGLGLAAAFQNRRVQKEFKGTAKTLKGVAKDIGKPFVPVWHTILSEAAHVAKFFRGPLKGAFRDFIAPAVSRFVHNLARAFERLKPAIRPMSRAFADLLDAIGPQLPAIFDKIADSLVDLANVVSQNPELFAQFITGMVEAIPLALKFVGALAKVYTQISEFTHSKNPLVNFLAPLSPALALFKHFGGSIRDVLAKIKDFGGKAKNFFGGLKKGKLDLDVKGVMSTLTRVTKSVARWAGKKFKAGLDLAWDAVKRAVPAALRMARRFGGRVFRALLSAANRVPGPVGLAMRWGLRFGRKVFRATLRAVNKAMPAILRATRAGLRFARRTYRATMRAVNRVAGPVSRAVRACLRFAHRLYRASLRATNRVDAVVSRAVRACLRFARRMYRAALRASFPGAGIIHRAIALARSFARTYTAKLRVIKPFMGLGGLFAHGGVIGGMATGGITRGFAHAAEGGPRGNQVLVGEQGPELVDLPFGSRVRPNGGTRAALAGGGAQRVVIELRSGGARIDDVLVEILRKAISAKGGNVQVVLGKGRA